MPVADGADRQPPTVYLTQPTGAVRLAGSAGAVKVVGVVVDDSGAVGAVSVNGAAAKLSPAAGARGLTVAAADLGEGASPDAVKNAMEFEQTVSVAAGAAVLVVEARDKAGNLTRLTIRSGGARPPSRPRSRAASSRWWWASRSTGSTTGA